MKFLDSRKDLNEDKLRDIRTFFASPAGKTLTDILNREIPFTDDAGVINGYRKCIQTMESIDAATRGGSPSEAAKTLENYE